MKVKVRRSDLRPGDLLTDMHATGEVTARVTGGAAARAKGYWVTFVEALTPRGRAYYPNGQTSGYRTDILEVERA